MIKEDKVKPNIACDCQHCELKEKCVYYERFQAVPRSEGGLGKCAWLHDGKLQY